MFKRFKKAAAAICAASMVLSMTACGSAGDKKVELHFTHTQSPGSISDLTAQEFKRLVEERSGGRIKVNIYSNCGLSGGDLTKAIELVQAGNIDIHSCAPPNIANYDKKFYSFWLPFLFPNSDDLLAFCHSDKVHDVVNGWCNDLEMEMLGINNAGSRQISNSKKEITKPEDLKGMNIRVPTFSLTCTGIILAQTPRPWTSQRYIPPFSKRPLTDRRTPLRCLILPSSQRSSNMLPCGTVSGTPLSGS